MIRQRENDHKHLWRSEFRIVEENRQAEELRHQDEMARSKTACAEQEAVLSKRITEHKEEIRRLVAGHDSPRAQAWLDSEEVTAANQNRDAAPTAAEIGRWPGCGSLERFHTDDGDGGCSCGKPLKRCAERQLFVEEVERTVHDWEGRQLDRLRQGKDHGLPDTHPEVGGTASARCQRRRNFRRF